MIRSKRLYLVNNSIFFDFQALRQAVETLKLFSLNVDPVASISKYQQTIKPKIGSTLFCTPR
jgi:hypothetical protein